VYYTVILHDGHLRTQGKCRKHEPRVLKCPELHEDVNLEPQPGLKVLNFCGRAKKVENAENTTHERLKKKISVQTTLKQ